MINPPFVTGVANKRNSGHQTGCNITPGNCHHLIFIGFQIFTALLKIQFTAIKEAELGKYLEAVGDESSARDEFTDWEKAFYLPYL